MTEQNTQPPQSLDDELLFDKKPTNRLVWIIPSVVIHLIVLGAWLMMPEDKPREIKQRELVVKSEQAAQLQDFVRDANLQEMRMEVSRLQEIKTMMQDIRKEQMKELQQFEKEIQGNLKQDTDKILKEVHDTQDVIMAKQRAVLQDIEKLSAIDKSFGPLKEKKDFAGAIPIAKQGVALRKSIEEKQAAALESLRVFKARLDATDGAISVIKDTAIREKWTQFMKLQEEIIALQSKSNGEMSGIKHGEGQYIYRIAEKGEAMLREVTSFQAALKKDTADYAAKTKELEDKLNELTQASREAAKEMKKQSELAKQKKRERENLDKELRKLKNSKDKQLVQSKKDHRAKAEAAYKKAQDLAHKSKKSQHSLDQVRRKLSNSLRHLRRPKLDHKQVAKQKDVINWLEKVGKSMAGVETHRQAFQKQVTAKKLAGELFSEVKKHMEAGQ